LLRRTKPGGQSSSEFASERRRASGSLAIAVAYRQPKRLSPHESLRQQIKCVAHYLLRVLRKLPVEAGIVVCVDPALENFGVSRSVKEPGRDTRSANPITGSQRGADLINLANHVVGRDMTCALAKRDEKFEG